jgi:hypothetical protein
MKKRMTDYKIMDKYGNIMKAFKKSEQANKKKNIDNVFIKIAKMIFNEYGIGLISGQTQKMIKNVRFSNRVYIIKYNKKYMNKHIL